MNSANDNQSFSDFFPPREWGFAARAIARTCAELKDAGISRDMLVQALFDYALAEAAGEEETFEEDRPSFINKVYLVKYRLDAILGEDEHDAATTGERDTGPAHGKASA